MKNNKGLLGLAFILVIIVVLAIIVFFFPKECGYWSSWGQPSEICDCIGFQYTPGGNYDGGPYWCFGIQK